MEPSPQEHHSIRGIAGTFPTSRRRLLAVLGATGAATIAAPSGPAPAVALSPLAAPRPTPAPVVVNVKELGARGDGVTDDTAAVQAAIDQGGVTWFPPGDYSCRTLTMRKATRLSGAKGGRTRTRTARMPPTTPSGA